MPHVALLATGGTIAGAAADMMSTATYRAGTVGVDELVAAVPSLGEVAAVSYEQLANIDSKDMTVALWWALTARVKELLADPNTDAVAITHGTDTLEETAYWLQLTTLGEKPVVLTAAMRPATALSADGPLNLVNAVTVAAHPLARGQGVMVVFANLIHAARDVTKISTYSATAFSSGEFGALGWVQDRRVIFSRFVPGAAPVAGAGLQRASAAYGRGFARDVAAELLPRVDIVLSYGGVSPIAVDALVESGTRGIVVAGTGNGTLHEELERALATAVRAGVAVVRSTRVWGGHVTRNAGSRDDELGFISAGNLNAYKARIVLMLGLAMGMSSAEQLQTLFDCQ
jgi:L-asparaginase